MDVLDLTRELVAVDSQNPATGEAEIVAWLESYCREKGFATRRVEPQPGRPNLIVTVDRAPGRHLGFSGHLDTKPIGDALGQWHTDPMVLTVVGDEAFGLGATDMKGGVAAMLVALERFAVDGPAGSVSLVLTADEEQGSAAGAQALAAAGMPPVDAIVIGEPSGIRAPWEALYLVSRGICCMEIDIRTTQGHSGLSSSLGRNAVLVAADLLHAFETFVPPVHEPGPVACRPTVNPGILVQGGVCFGTWPGLCTIGVELRLVPGMDRDEVRSAIRHLVDTTLDGRAEADVRYREGSLGWMPAVGLDPAHPLVSAAQDAAAGVLGAALPVAAYPGGTDASYFMGTAGVPTITSLGPGWLSVAHGPNEKVGVNQLHEAVDLYAELARIYLAAEEPPARLPVPPRRTSAARSASSGPL